MLNFSMNSPGKFNGCHLKIIDSGAFRCKKAYIKIFSANNQQLILRERQSSTGFDFSGFIPSDFCAGGIEIGYDISWGIDWPFKEKLVHGQPYKDKIIDLNSLTIKISGTTFFPHFEIIDGSLQKITF